MLVGLLLVALLTQRSRTVVGLDPSGLLGSAYPALFEVVVTIYLGAVISSGIFFFTRTLSVTSQVSFALYSDVFALTLLMHASGGTTSGLGLLISAFLNSQVAATFATAIICLIPSVNFSGLLYPVSTLSGAALWVGKGFPSSWFQLISLGAFTKGLGVSSFGPMYLALTSFGVLYLLVARLMVRKQEA